MPKVSVLMGVYNCADTVEKSIDSIVVQTFTDWELIICDDGSSDKTLEIITKYAQKEPRIHVIQNEHNRGLSFTLNHCLEAAKGEYCARMDGDDLCAPCRFEKQVKFLDDHPEYGLVSTDMKRFNENGYFEVHHSALQESPTIYDFIKGTPFCHAPVMIRKSVYEAVEGYRVSENVWGVEDYDLWFRIYAKGYIGYNLNEKLYSMFDGQGASNRRTWRRRENEAWVRYNGYRMLHLPIWYRTYVFKPIIIGLIPHRIYNFIRKLV